MIARSLAGSTAAACRRDPRGIDRRRRSREGRRSRRFAVPCQPIRTRTGGSCPIRRRVARSKRSGHRVAVAEANHQGRQFRPDGVVDRSWCRPPNSPAAGSATRCSLMSRRSARVRSPGVTPSTPTSRSASIVAVNRHRIGPLIGVQKDPQPHETARGVAGPTAAGAVRWRSGGRAGALRSAVRRGVVAKPPRSVKLGNIIDVSPPRDW